MDSDANNKPKDEEIITRRRFFKKAAGMILPMLGALVLSSVPNASNAKNSISPSNTSRTPMNCNGSCSGSCSGSCKGGCGRSCSLGANNGGW